MNGKGDAEARPRPGGAACADVAAVLLDDAVGQGQPQARPLADGLGGEEGVEDLVENIGGDALAIVGHFYPCLLYTSRCV